MRRTTMNALICALVVVGCQDATSPDPITSTNSTAPLHKTRGFPTKIVIVEGDDQSGPSGELLPVPVSISVVDDYGLPIGNWPISFAPGSASGRIITAVDKGTGSAPLAKLTTAKNTAVVYTSAEGTIEVGWMLGSVGENSLVVEALTRTFLESIAGVHVQVTAHAF